MATKIGHFVVHSHFFGCASKFETMVAVVALVEAYAKEAGYTLK